MFSKIRRNRSGKKVQNDKTVGLLLAQKIWRHTHIFKRTIPATALPPEATYCRGIATHYKYEEAKQRYGVSGFWVKLREKGYTRTIPALFRVMQRQGYFKDKVPKNSKYTPKPYEQMQYPGQRVQIDVKYVPAICTQAIGKGTSFYQFTAIDEYSRQRYLEGFPDNSSYSAAIFLQHAIRYFKFKIECVQTDNGSEFTKHYQSKNPTKTLFQKALEANGIRHKLIKVFTPRHNGKVERSHRKDQERFYNKHSFYSLEDYNNQLRKYNREYNNFPMRPLNWLSPNQYLQKYFSQRVTNVWQPYKKTCIIAK